MGMCLLVVTLVTQKRFNAFVLCTLSGHTFPKVGVIRPERFVQSTKVAVKGFFSKSCNVIAAPTRILFSLSNNVH